MQKKKNKKMNIAKIRIIRKRRVVLMKSQRIKQQINRRKNLRLYRWDVSIIGEGVRRNVLSARNSLPADFVMMMPST